MVTLGIREITNAGLAQDIRPKVYSKACVSGKARSMPRLRWKNGLPGMLPQPRALLPLRVVVLVGVMA